jgi:hypothetical protein
MLPPNSRPANWRTTSETVQHDCVQNYETKRSEGPTSNTHPRPARRAGPKRANRAALACGTASRKSDMRQNAPTRIRPRNPRPRNPKQARTTR